MGIAYGDYYSKPIYVNMGIPIGGEGEQATQLYVSYISGKQNSIFAHPS